MMNVKVMFRMILSGSLVILSLGQTQSESKIYVSHRISTDLRLHISCTAVGPFATQLVVHLECPLTKSHLCYSNCTVPCRHIDGVCESPKELRAIESCAYQKYAPDKVVVDYTVDSRLVHKKGRWRCLFHGKESTAIPIDAAEPTPEKKKEPPTIRPPVVIPSPPPRENKEKDNINIDAPNPPEKPQNNQESNSNSPMLEPSRKNKSKFGWINLTRPDLVLALFGLLAISLVVNIAFCVRCVLLKNYVENIDQGVEEQECLEKCLCLTPDLYRKLSHTQRSRRSGSSRQDSVYEDLAGFGGSSRGRRSSNTFDTVVDEKGTPILMIPVGQTPKHHHGYPSPASSQMSRGSYGSYPRPKTSQQTPVSYYQNGYLPSSGSGGRNNYVIVTGNPPGSTGLQRRRSNESGHTIYDDVPLERPKYAHQQQHQQHHQQQPYSEDYMSSAQRHLQQQLAMLPPPAPQLLEEDEDMNGFGSGGEASLRRQKVYLLPQTSQITTSSASPSTMTTQDGEEVDPSCTIDLIQHCSKNEAALTGLNLTDVNGVPATQFTPSPGVMDQTSLLNFTREQQ